MALTHSTGFHNFWFIEPDKKLQIHFDPGSRYSYSGEGFSLLQFTIEQGARTKGLGLDVKALTDAIVRAKPAGAKGKYVQKVALSSSMGPGLKIDVTEVEGA